MTDEKKKSTLDKIVMGALIGTAVGSAVSLTLAPKTGKETRDFIKEKSKDVGGVAKETGVGFFRLFKVLLRRLFRGKKKTASVNEMKELPDEMEVFPKETQE
ncbi:YtxH domain-containing protein [Candidatus Peregrinibacteria bacterium]|nr:MAG: YtxH domain-containing protein [Candidatus Peregrinibacteria bacterium]